MSSFSTKLDVQLAVLERAIGARVLVAETPRDLEVAVEPANHEDLLQHLRGLRQRPELSRVVPRRNDEVARAGRVGPNQVGGLDLPEPALDHEVAYEVDDLVPQTHELPRTFASKINVSELPAEVLIDLRLLVDVEGRGLRLVQHFDLASRDLYVARRELRVFRALGSRPHCPADSEDPLVADLPEGGVCGRVLLRVRDDLREAVAVAEIDEGELAVVTAGMYPSGKRDFLARERGARLAAGMRSQHDLVPIVLQERRLARRAGLVLVGVGGPFV
jgi:hypothetical protein